MTLGFTSTSRVRIVSKFDRTWLGIICCTSRSRGCRTWRAVRSNVLLARLYARQIHFHVHVLGSHLVD